MKPSSTRLPEALNRHLSDPSPDECLSTVDYVARGGALTDAAAMEALDRLLPGLRDKSAELEGHDLLRKRLELLATTYTEMRAERRGLTAVLRELAFALLYFLKGTDRIPDSVPEVGLADDALVVQTVLDRHGTELRARWARQGRRWPEAAQPGGSSG